MTTATILWSKGIHSAILLNDIRTKKKDGNKEVWVSLLATPEYRRGKRERYKVERKFGEAKQNHGLRRCRCVGWIGYAIRVFMTAVALNLKRLVRLLEGVGFRGPARAKA